jgi:hypothetical protein
MKKKMKKMGKMKKGAVHDAVDNFPKAKGTAKKREKRLEGKPL